MSAKRNVKPNARQSRGKTPGLPVWLIVAGAALVLVALGAAFSGRLFSDSNAVKVSPAANPSGGAASGAALSVDPPRIDLGDVKLGQSVTVVFTLTNTGGSALRFTEAPYIEVKEGC